HRQHDRAGGRALLHRTGPARAHAVVGRHGRERSRQPARRVVGRDVPGSGHSTGRARVQPGGRGSARRAGPAAAMSALLRVESLRTHFRTPTGVARAVDGVDFEVAAGEVVGIVGESGSGKTVTALSILRLLPDASAAIQPGSRIVFRGRDLLALEERAMRQVRGNDIAMVFQEPMTSLNPAYTAGEQIAEPLRVHRSMGRRAAEERAVELLGLVGIADPASCVNAYPHQLSGGQRQRVMIAIALACEPALLIADEPTSALDVTIQAQILELLTTLRDRLGMAIMLITHDLGVVAEACERVIVMYGGQVVEQATTRALFERPTHPYTQGLLRALPRLGRRGERLAGIPGAVRGATDWPAGCGFHPRCPYAWDRCATEWPPLLRPESGAPVEEAGARVHAARCWLVDEPERRLEVDRAGRGFQVMGGPA